MQDRSLSRAYRIGVAGPVGSGKTALVDCLSRILYPAYNVAVITNDIYTKEDAEFLVRQGTLPTERIRGVETGGCPHAAIREDASMNLEAIADLEEQIPDLQLIFVESGGDNLAASFSPELVDAFIYVIDVAEGEKIPRKGGPGIIRSDLLVINKIDLARAVGASLAVMERDTQRMRSTRPYVMTNLKDGTGLNTIVDWVEQRMQVPPEKRAKIIDAHAPYQGTPHTHSHSHTHSHRSDDTRDTLAPSFTGSLASTTANAIYFDCFSGISGDMTLGCLVDSGLDLAVLQEELKKLDLPPFSLTAERQMRGYLSGTKVKVHLPEENVHRSFADIRAIITNSQLSEEIKTRSLHIFSLLARAEGFVHGVPAESVQFHEVGSLDAIVDIVGSVIGLSLLGIEHVFASPLPLGSGWVQSAHGKLPIPAPAVLYILAHVNAPTIQDDTPTELVTPTGAAILAGLATFKRPPIQLQRVGYGLGTKELARPNALRAWYGTLLEENAQSQFPHTDALLPLLPSRDADGQQSISAATMESAPLIYGADGRVAWDQIWSDFCDLALAGGPPHRGTLLEPVPIEEIRAQPEAYERVVAEIERGWQQVTNCPTVHGSTGWVGLVCENESMALWLLRAILVENVCVRREGSIIFLPAGPAFRLEEEIKNVITVVAKTHHYWTEHVDRVY